MVKDYTTVLEKKEQLTESVWKFGFRIQNDTIEFSAGQYVLLKVNESYRQYSICYPAKKTDYFELVIEIVEGGLASTYIVGRNVGDQVFFKGPAGIFTLKDTPRHKVFLATGTGVAPMYSMVSTALEGSEKPITEEIMGPGAVSYTLFFGLKYAKDVYLFEECKKIAENKPEFHFKICLSREESLDAVDPVYFEKGRMNDSVKQFLEGKNVDEYEFYVCGGAVVVQSLKEFLASLGVRSEHIFCEMFNQVQQPSA